MESNTVFVVLFLRQKLRQTSSPQTYYVAKDQATFGFCFQRIQFLMIITIHNKQNIWMSNGLPPALNTFNLHLFVYHLQYIIFTMLYVYPWVGICAPESRCRYGLQVARPCSFLVPRESQEQVIRLGSSDHNLLSCLAGSLLSILITFNFIPLNEWLNYFTYKCLYKTITT